jgi:hypothetical protein
VYSLLTNHTSKAVSATIPSKIVGPDSRSWWDEELQELVNTRSEAYVALRNYSHNLGTCPLVPDETYNVLWNKYVQLRRQVHSLASVKKNQQWQTLLSKLETDFVSDRNHFYSEIVRIRRKKSSSTALISLRDGQNLVTDDPNKVKKMLFDLHSNWGKEEPDTANFDRLHYFSITSVIAAISNTETGPAFCEQKISIEEIRAAIDEAQNNKVVGLDQIANEPLKYAAKHVANALHTLFNILLQAGTCPKIWSKALVHLIFKGRGADPLDPRAYRPISLTSCISKIFERVILNRLNQDVERKGLLEEKQAGFRSGRSTRDQTYILRKILDSRKASGQTTFLCFIDLTNAFPSTWQDGMWYRLQELGVTGKLFRSIRLMYQSCSSAIQTPYGLTDWYTSDLGT